VDGLLRKGLPRCIVVIQVGRCLKRPDLITESLADARKRRGNLKGQGGGKACRFCKANRMADVATGKGVGKERKGVQAENVSIVEGLSTLTGSETASSL